MKQEGRVLGIVGEAYVCRHEGRVYAHLSFGRVIDRLAARYPKVFLCTPVAEGPPDSTRDYLLAAANVEVVPQPFFSRTTAGLRRPLAIAWAYARVCRRADVLFVRGMPLFMALFYLIAFLCRCKVCHWIVGNPVALLQSHRRADRLKDAAALAYACVDRLAARLGRWLVGGAFICNGEELGRIFRSPRTRVTVSGTVMEEEFFERADTCQGSVVRILFLGFIRPEKGVEYLIEAALNLSTERPWQLVIVGPSGPYEAYRRRLEAQIDRIGIRERVHWGGYVSYGPEMFRYLREADVFAFPSLSEGTPRVLVEARANSLPVVATRVGGIPTSICDGVDGLLVPPAAPKALASAIDRVIEDGDLRRSLIRNGLASARRMTVDAFVDRVLPLLDGALGDGPEPCE